MISTRKEQGDGGHNKGAERQRCEWISGTQVGGNMKPVSSKNQKLVIEERERVKSQYGC